MPNICQGKCRITVYVRRNDGSYGLRNDETLCQTVCLRKCPMSCMQIWQRMSQTECQNICRNAYHGRDRWKQSRLSAGRHWQAYNKRDADKTTKFSPREAKEQAAKNYVYVLIHFTIITMFAEWLLCHGFCCTIAILSPLCEYL